MFTSNLPRICVVGANVYGYTTAILLLLEGYKVTIIAGDHDYSSTANHPDDTTSHWQTLAPVSDASLQEYDIASFKMFWKLAKHKAFEAGIMVGSSFKYYQDPTEDQSNPWWKHIVPSAILINSKRYLHWLQSQFLLMGGRQKKIAMTNLSDAIITQEHANILVNCSDGLALSTNDGELGKKIVQQQQWITRASHIRKSVHVKIKDEEMYIYPRMDGTVIFGSRQYTNKDATTKINATNVLDRISEYCPELTWGNGIHALDITMDQEPVTKSIRQHAPRIETQITVTPMGRKLAVIHNYGHDGYQSSWGTSKRAVSLVNAAFANLKKDSQAVSELLSNL